MAQAAVAPAWRPLHYTLFRNLWRATIVANVGSWMHIVAKGWLKKEKLDELLKPENMTNPRLNR